ncbi:GntG family PLP-dependent aldolase [Rummeliibacillus suwonensis]|uniref:GntG family PLP-dependent aldolase n=1 Tax=Rummeliibacillus suwonensis TaxID=1306154 RepID=UPI001AAFF83E|nr:GntG family PLP-dependent aldolase [Rummeliibacillus suwonensis]MBO2535979.1 threonine aldolase [Rummeliibacillus suwonensis]
MINYLSDTITLPTKEMLESIQHASLGDDVYGMDTTVNNLELLASRIVGKEDACFMPSGTMANLSSIMAHCPRGSKILVGNESDIYIYEAGGASICGGIVYEPIPTQEDGRLLVEDLQKAFPPDFEDPQYALPSLICLENTHNRCGGRVLPLKYLEEVKTFAENACIPIHMDGARLFNAAISLKIDVKEITKYADSLQFCLSKGLSAPVGSLVAGSKNFIKKVKRIRKMLGGGMRQAGILAAPGIVALNTMTERLKDDHTNAKLLAKGLEEIDGISLESNHIESNIVIFNVLNSPFTTLQFIELCKSKGIIFSEAGHEKIRAVTHRHIKETDIAVTITSIEEIINQYVKI